MQRPTLPLGVDNFGKLVRYRNSKGKPYLFIDKSMLIEAFVDTNDTISLITRPRRFGKTLNLSMLQHFFAVKVGQESTASLFEGLKISGHPEIMDHQGRYPVIFITLKAVRGRDFDECLATFKGVVAERFKEHCHLLEEGGLAKYDQKVFYSMLEKKATIEEYKSSLRFLSQLLYAHHGQQVIILLDEYDTPVHDAVEHHYFEDLKALLAPVMHNAFKGNDALHKAMVTGILKVAQASFFSELNNIGVHTMLHPSRYAPYFGFTEQETNALLQQAGLTPQKEALQAMYNGYAIGKVTLYNPWSILGFIDGALQLDPGQPIELALRPYWINTGGTHLIETLLQENLGELQETLQCLLEGQAVTTAINEDVTFVPHTHYDKKNFCSLMLLSGYLKVVGEALDLLGREIYHLTFPNEEVKRTMEDMVLRATTAERNNLTALTSSLEALVQGKVAPFHAFLETYLQDTPSYHDTKGKAKEQFFHGILLGLTAGMCRIYSITSNRESGQGRYDLALEPKGKGKGIVMEFKVAEEKEELQTVAQEAYDQAVAKEYTHAMQQRGVTDILVLGLAFRGKEVALAS